MRHNSPRLVSKRVVLSLQEHRKQERKEKNKTLINAKGKNTSLTNNGKEITSKEKS